MNSYFVTCTCELQLVVDKLKVEIQNTLSFKVCIETLIIHWKKKQAELSDCTVHRF